MNLLLLAGGLLVFVSILLTPISARTGAPLLLVFLGIGMLVGEDGLGGIAFDDFAGVHSVGSLALAIILLSGGLDTSKAAMRKVAAPALVLATLGVVLTSIVVGFAAASLFHVPLTHGLLLGAVVASTDAAATFLLLQQRDIRLKGRITETIVVESGLNDPMAIFLTIGLVEIVASEASLTWAMLPDVAPDLLMQLGLGALAGVAGGRGMAWLIGRIGLQSGLYPPLVLSGALALFGATQMAGGSGFLAIYLCGVSVSASAPAPHERIAHFHEALAWLSQIVMFLMLGLLVTPRDLGGVAVPALAMAAVLMFIARPLAVFACLTPFGYGLRQQLFVGWVGLRGAVPIFLAIIPVISPGPMSVGFFNIVFVIVIASLVLQGWTIPAVARWLGVSGDDKAR